MPKPVPLTAGLPLVLHSRIDGLTTVAESPQSSLPAPNEKWRKFEKIG